jgi:hypothetical protein
MTEKGRLMTTITRNAQGARTQVLAAARPDGNTVALRPATAEDAPSLRILTELDEEPELAGEVLLATVDGEAVAAMSLRDGRIAANPFVATADAVALLRLRARHLAGRRPRRRLRPRFA